MQSIITSFKESMDNFRKVKVLAAAAMLVALTVILSFLVIYFGSSTKVSFAFVPMAAGSMLFGPVVGGAVGALSDIIGYIIKPVGPYMPFFTITCALTGLIYGVFLFNRKITLGKIIIAQLIVSVFLNLFLDTYWLTLLYGDAFMAMLPLRALKCVLFFPVQVFLMYVMAKYMPVFKKRFNY